MALTFPGSKQFWKSFGLDLVSFVEQRGLSQFFLTLTAHDLWPQVQATLAHGWGSCASGQEVQSLSVENRQPVGFHPEVSVLAAEKRYHWFMNIQMVGPGSKEGVPEEGCRALAHVSMGQRGNHPQACCDGRDATRP